MIDISLRQLVSDLESGLTRYKNEDFGFGSIEEKYGMTSKEVAVIFRHPKLKDLQPTFRFRLIDDLDMDFDAPKDTLSEVPVPSTVVPQTGQAFNGGIPDDVRYIESPRAAAQEINIPGSQFTEPKPAANVAEDDFPAVQATPVQTPAPAATTASTRVFYEDAGHDLVGLL